jgi:predicted deacetylase
MDREVVPIPAPAAEPAPPGAEPRTEIDAHRRAWPAGRALAVTLHDIEPRTFDRVREIRRWLAAHRVDRVTLAVIPAADLHPIGTRAPLLASWLRAQVARGDAIAQHGLRHRGAGPEFASLDLEESRGRVEPG